MTLFNGNNDTGPVFEKGYPRHEGYEEYMKRRMAEEDALIKKYPTFGDVLEICDRIEAKLKLLEQRMKNVETDIAYINK